MVCCGVLISYRPLDARICVRSRQAERQSRTSRSLRQNAFFTVRLSKIQEWRKPFAPILDDSAFHFRAASHVMFAIAGLQQFNAAELPNHLVRGLRQFGCFFVFHAPSLTGTVGQVRWTPKTGPQVKMDFCRSAAEKKADYESKTETA